MNTLNKIIVFFDFDHTLITGDSLWPFLCFVGGRISVLKALIIALFRYFITSPEKILPLNRENFRTFIKGSVLNDILSGKNVTEIKPGLDKLFLWQQWNEKVREALLNHHAQGHHIVIASGGLNLYLPFLLKDIPYHALICTEIEISKGRITGKMVSGNCVRETKAQKISSYIQKFGPYTDSWGYGNFPDDLPMLNLLNHKMIV